MRRMVDLLPFSCILDEAKGAAARVLRIDLLDRAKECLMDRSARSSHCLLRLRNCFHQDKRGLKNIREDPRVWTYS